MDRGDRDLIQSREGMLKLDKEPLYYNTTLSIQLLIQVADRDWLSGLNTTVFEGVSKGVWESHGHVSRCRGTECQILVASMTGLGELDNGVLR
jgi:hypothetical protein